MSVNLPDSKPEASFADTILQQSSEISRRLDMLRIENFPPDAQKRRCHVVGNLTGGG